MQHYRLYYIDRFSGHIDNFREFELEDDATALALAERWRDPGQRVELWNRERMLGHWDCDASD